MAGYLMGFLSQRQNLTTAELSVETGLPYAAVSDALRLARDARLVTFEREPRDDGGERFRYRVGPELQDLLLQGKGS